MPRGAKRSHIEPAAQSAPSTEDGAFAAEQTAVVVKRRQASQSGRFAAIELTELGHLREQERGRTRAHSSNGSEFLRFKAKGLVLRDEIGNARIECVDLPFDFANQAAA